ncbi:MAG: hypothetical protein AAF732_04435 [Pseudomonadota bacterium]
MLLGAHAFVTIVFGTMALSFVASTAVLAWEFWEYRRWVDFMAMDSHLFVFFPTFGVISLLAFYLPSVVFVDHYWRHVPLGKVRFVIGLVVFVVASHYFTQLILSGQNRSMWDVAPAVLETDRGQPAGCTEQVGPNGEVTCERLPLLTAMNSLRKLSQQRLGVSEFVRDCSLDPLIQPTEKQVRPRYCAATTPFPKELENASRGVAPKAHWLVEDAACCTAQEKLVTATNALYAPEANRSLTGVVHAALLPLKVFFLLILLAISFLLTLRFEGISQYYASRLRRIEAGVIVGALAALFFPLMSQAFLQSLQVLVGEAGKGAFSAMVPVMSLMFGAWTLLLVLFFFRRNGDNVELLTKIASAAAGGVALLKYEVIVSFLVRVIGSGASWIFFAVLGGMALLMAFVVVRILVSDPVEPEEAPKAEPAT